MANTKASNNSKKAAYRRNAAKKKPTQVNKQPIKKEINQVEKPKVIEEQKVITNKKTVKNTTAMAGLICSVCGFITCGITSIIGIILSIIGLNKSKKLNGVGKDVAARGIFYGVFTALLFSILFLIFIFSAKTAKETIKRAKNRNIPVYEMNTDIKINDSYGNYSIKVTGVREASERSKTSNIKADRVIVIAYEYKNIDMEQNLFISGSRFSAYDSRNVILQPYPVDYLLPDYISKGRTSKAEVAYALNNSDNKMELEYYKNAFDERPFCIIKIKW